MAMGPGWVFITRLACTMVENPMEAAYEDLTHTTSARFFSRDLSRMTTKSNIPSYASSNFHSTISPLSPSLPFEDSILHRYNPTISTSCTHCLSSEHSNAFR
ncbi:hypothetical protein TWF718_005169 [Orbilia javanica]|uniref:Uncharacterized protein n=1 Tax=Orbilia javanica TaxID=47235 RepID=A0AAN8NDG1_9PEZI